MQDFYQHVQHELAAFRESEFLTESVHEVQQQLDRFYHAYSIQTANLGNCLIYRVRVCNGDQPHFAASDIWIPPAERLKSVARANDIGQRIFYGAFDPYTAIKEARVPEGEFFTMGVYHLHAKEDFHMTSVVIHTPPKPNSWRNIQQKLAHELSVFVVSEFTKPVQPGQDHLYKKSCAIAQTLLGLPKKDSLLYPSIQDADMINIALPEPVASERLTLKSVFHCQLRSEAYVLRESSPIEGQPELIEVINQSPRGYRFNLIGEPMRFSQTFHHSKITTTDELIRYFAAKKLLQSKQH